MTLVPELLKFRRPLYPDLQTLYETWPTSEDKIGRFRFVSISLCNVRRTHSRFSCTFSRSSL
ncbi:hypothetical protein B0H14DRAFT_1631010 [Mycena olivaceomarginata]|nr:hypothetical protein B0H14DRAFT_1631010 [Mycena olivaceomarginata]